MLPTQRHKSNITNKKWIKCTVFKCWSANVVSFFGFGSKKPTSWDVIIIFYETALLGAELNSVVAVYVALYAVVWYTVANALNAFCHKFYCSFAGTFLPVCRKVFVWNITVGFWSCRFLIAPRLKSDQKQSSWSSNENP